MKKKLLLFFVVLIFPLFLHAQGFDSSEYQEVSLREAYENRKNDPEGNHYYLSLVHITGTHYNSFMGYMQVFAYKDDQTSSLKYYPDFPRLEPFQVAVIYFHFLYYPEHQAFDVILDRIEPVNDQYFIVGDRYTVQENLRLRSTPNLSGSIKVTMQKGEFVTVLEEGEVETIDDVTSAWVKVRLKNNTEGWCFGGYLRKLF